MSQTEHLAGTVERIVYHNDTNGFVILRLQLKNKQLATVCGHMPQVTPGEQVTLSGLWETHPKFGRQFAAQSCTAHQPTSIVGLKKYLSSGLIKGIGPVYGEKLVDHFGIDVLTIIDETPERLSAVEGIGAKRIERITAAWQDQKAVAHIMVFLQEKGISAAYATKIYKRYGAEAVSVISENPYRLAHEVWGIGFKVADQIAQNMGFEKSSAKRITAGLLHGLSTIGTQGHLYAKLANLKETTIELLELPHSAETATTIKLSLHQLYDEDKIRLITKNDEHYICTPKSYFAEKGIATLIKKLHTYQSPHQFNIEEIYQELRASSQNSMQLNDDQQRGILACLQHKVTIITGGPGTGKTTLIKQLLQILDAHKARFRLAAPTGRAAKRMNESTGKHAETIHRLLEFDVSSMKFSRNEGNALITDFLIIDESSMLDVHLAYALIKATPSPAHLIFVGDVDQLPSVGPGNVLRDLIASGEITAVHLSHIFRQAQDSLIVTNAHRINEGTFPTSQSESGRRDFLFIKEENPEHLFEHLKTIITRGLPKCKIAPHEMIVLSPMHRGIAGTMQLNHELQQLLNPPQERPHLQRHGIFFSVGDRVMQLRNNYDKAVFNGDTGIVEGVDTEDHILTVRYQDRQVTYEQNELDEITLAYAISIHKSQGSEYPAVVIPIFMQHYVLLQRNLLYTAVTRAKQLCILIGQPKAVHMAINNNTTNSRITFLQDFLTSDLSCR